MPSDDDLTQRHLRGFMDRNPEIDLAATVQELQDAVDDKHRRCPSCDAYMEDDSCPLCNRLPVEELIIVATIGGALAWLCI